MTNLNPPDPIELPAPERIRAVIHVAFGGLHHVEKVLKFQEGRPNEYWTCLTYGDMATYDSNALTLLVIGAHKYGCRVGITAAGPRRLKVTVWARQKRTGEFWERHPTMASAVELYEQPYPEMMHQ
jgi:hypothetical protein